MPTRHFWKKRDLRTNWAPQWNFMTQGDAKNEKCLGIQLVMWWRILRHHATWHQFRVFAGGDALGHLLQTWKSPIQHSSFQQKSWCWSELQSHFTQLKGQSSETWSECNRIHANRLRKQLITPSVAVSGTKNTQVFLWPSDDVMRYVASPEVTAALAGSTHGARPLFTKPAYMIVNDREFSWITGSTVVTVVYCHACWNADGVGTNGKRTKRGSS